MKLGVLGLGNMGGSIARGALQQGVVRAEDLMLFDPMPDAGRDIGGTRVQSVEQVAAEADVIVIATKPNGVVSVLQQLTAPDVTKQRSTPAIVISVAAGLRLQTMREGGVATKESAKPALAGLVRAMPNLGSGVGAGITAWKADTELSDADRTTVESLLSAIGDVVELPDEELFHAFTGAVGSGIAYLFLAAEAIADGAVAEGLPRPLAQKAATAAVFGAGSVLRSSDDGPATWKDRVCSPGGTTIAGIVALEQAGVRRAFIDAVRAAADKSRQLANQGK